MIKNLEIRRKMKRKIRTLSCICATLALSVLPIKAYACCTCAILITTDLEAEWPTTEQEIKDRVATEFDTLRTFLVGTVWEDNILPAMMLLTDQVSAVATYQTFVIGTFFDAKHQLETQRTLQKIRARAHKDYHPSEGMCEFGSSTKSLAASERKSELTAHIMSQRFQDRMLGNTNTAAAGGPNYDKSARLKQFREKFCDPTNNDAGMDQLCEHGGNIGADDMQRMNKDIDYLRTVDAPWTLNVDFTDTDLTHNEEEILALADNLYGHEVFNRLTGTDVTAGGIKPVEGNDDEELHHTYMDARAVLAKLSVAKNSYNSITSMKSSGTSSSREFMAAILEELGISGTSGEIDNQKALLGYNPDIAGEPEIGPSYYAQMEVLTKKIYQNPDFYTSLYDKPANIERKKVAMQAIALMQKFDLFKSYLRYESSLSVLLELAVIDLQNKVEQEISDQSKTAER